MSFSDPTILDAITASGYIGQHELRLHCLHRWLGDFSTLLRCAWTHPLHWSACGGWIRGSDEKTVIDTLLRDIGLLQRLRYYVGAIHPFWCRCGAASCTLGLNSPQHPSLSGVWLLDWPGYAWLRKIPPMRRRLRGYKSSIPIMLPAKGIRKADGDDESLQDLES